MYNLSEDVMEWLKKEIDLVSQGEASSGLIRRVADGTSPPMYYLVLTEDISTTQLKYSRTVKDEPHSREVEIHNLSFHQGILPKDMLGYVTVQNPYMYCKGGIVFCDVRVFVALHSPNLKNSAALYKRLPNIINSNDRMVLLDINVSVPKDSKKDKIVARFMLDQYFSKEARSRLGKSSPDELFDTITDFGSFEELWSSVDVNEKFMVKREGEKQVYIPRRTGIEGGVLLYLTNGGKLRVKEIPKSPKEVEVVRLANF